jgi:uncharacterized protein
MNLTPADEEVLTIERPHKDLWRYYLIGSFALGPLFPILMVYGTIRFKTMRYRFTSEGISMSWGILFRREIIIQYSRIQDIHLRSNVLERWLGLAKVLVQTASGSAGAEMTLEGLKQFEAVRDFLYHRMRGVKDDERVPGRTKSGDTSGTAAAGELVEVLQAVATELRAIRQALAERGGDRD